MKNSNKTLSSSTQFAARVALRAMISKCWHNRKNAQQIRHVSNVEFWTTEIKENISALREIRGI